MLKAGDLLDPILVAKIGSVDTQILHGWFSICKDAVLAVLGLETWNLLSQDELLAERTIPWVWDLTRGLHFENSYGQEIPQTADLVKRLSSQDLNNFWCEIIADKIDWACILTEDRVAQYIQGLGAIRMDALSRESSFPWYTRVLLGYRIRLTTEALRLMPLVDRNN
jgi:hypothetical protein